MYLNVAGDQNLNSNILIFSFILLNVPSGTLIKSIKSDRIFFAKTKSGFFLKQCD